MATIFTVNYGGTYGGVYEFKAEATESNTSIPNNTSKVTVTIYVRRTNSSSNGAWTNNGTAWSITIDGTKTTGTSAFDTRNSTAWKSLGSASKTITHNSNGTKSITISATHTGVSGAGMTSASGSGTMTLSTIPRYGTSVQSLNTKTETSIKINWSSDSTIDYIWYSANYGSTWHAVGSVSAKSGSYTISGLSANTKYGIKTRVRRKDSQLTTDSSSLEVTTYDYPYCTSTPNFKIGDLLKLDFYNPLKRTFSFYIIANGTQIANSWSISGTSYSGVNAESSQNQLYATIPNAQSGKYQVKVVYGSSTKTRNNGNTFTVKGTEVPSFSEFEYKDSNIKVTNVTNNDQIMVKGLSNVQVTITSDNKMTTQKSATGKNYVISMANLSSTVNYNTNDIITELGVIKSSGNQRLNVNAYDSRGLKTLVYKDITVYDYNKPTINASARRLNSFENETTIKINGKYTKLTIDNTDKNTLTTTQYKYRETGGEWSGWVNLTTTIVNGTFTCNDVILSLDNTKSFEFQIQVIDSFEQVSTSTVIVEVGIPIFFISSNKRECYINNHKVITELGGNIDKITTGISKYMQNGDFGLNLQNSDLINANGIFMNDESTTHEGINFLKQNGDKTKEEDYECLRGYRGSLYYDDIRIPNINDLFYKVNDVEYAGVNICAGHVTSSTTQIVFMFFPPKNMHNISTVSVTAGTITVRGISGYVQDSYNNPIKLAGGGHTVSALKRNDGSIMITVTKGGSSAWANVTNNTPVSVYTSGFNLKFT